MVIETLGGLEGAEVSCELAWEIGGADAGVAVAVALLSISGNGLVLNSDDGVALFLSGGGHCGNGGSSGSFSLLAEADAVENLLLSSSLLSPLLKRLKRAFIADRTAMNYVSADEGYKTSANVGDCVERTKTSCRHG